jgi:DNA-binding response OmpR family regulator
MIFTHTICSLNVMEIQTPYVLTIDRDRSYANSLEIAFRSEKVAFRHFTDYNIAQPFLEDPNCVAAVIARNLEGASGLQLTKVLRSESSTTKLIIIIVSHVYDEYDVIEALDAGADDYMGKPVAVKELVCRFKAILRRRAFEEDAPEVGIKQDSKLNLKIDTGTAFLNDRPLKLTPSEFEILQRLVRSPKQVLSRDQLLSSLSSSNGGGQSGNKLTDSARKIDVYINGIRAELMKFDAAPRIKTVRGFGYLISEIRSD